MESSRRRTKGSKHSLLVTSAPFFPARESHTSTEAVPKETQAGSKGGRAIARPTPLQPKESTFRPWTESPRPIDMGLVIGKVQTCRWICDALKIDLSNIHVRVNRGDDVRFELSAAVISASTLSRYLKDALASMADKVDEDKEEGDSGVAGVA